MSGMCAVAARARHRGAGALALGACLCTGALALQTRSAAAARSRSASAEEGVASVVECVSSAVESQRSATFSGEMTAIPGTARMAVRIEVQERLPGQTLFHMIPASGLGVWRPSDAKVKIYKYVKQVTNLSAPAAYRALVRFRWLNAHGHVIKRGERYTGHCLQPQPAPPQPQPAPSQPPAATAPAAALATTG